MIRTRPGRTGLTVSRFCPRVASDAVAELGMELTGAEVSTIEGACLLQVVVGMAQRHGACPRPIRIPSSRRESLR